MSTVLLPLAHAGEGATWQALLTLLSLGLVAVVVLVALRAVTLKEPGDLILPLAGVAVLASLSGATSEVLSDWVGWAFPLGVVSLVVLVLVATTSLRLAVTAPLLPVAVVVAVIASFALRDPIARAWHPTPTSIESARLDDLAVEIVSPDPDATVSPGTVEVVVRASGGTLGPGFVDDGAPTDPEELVGLTLTVVSLSTGQNTAIEGTPAEDCSAGCTQATYTVTIDEPGQWSIFIEAKTADARSFVRGGDTVSTPTTSVTVEVA